MLLDHNGVDRFWVLKREKAEPARAAGGAITHYLTVDDLAELGEVLFEGFWLNVSASIFLLRSAQRPHTIGGFPVEPSNEHLSA